MQMSKKLSMSKENHLQVDFIGIGVQKSATTWVYKVLEDHPEVTCSQPKELNFFSRNFEKGSDWYHTHFNPKKKNTRLGEISPSYFTCVESVVRAKTYNPNLKIIVVLRDPIERAYSNHLHMIRVNDYPYKDLSFETGLKADARYLEQSRYGKHLHKWFQSFSRKNILVLIQENIKENPVQEAQKLYEFLGIDVKYKSLFLDKKANVSYSFKNEKLNLFIKGIISILNRSGLNIIVRRLRKSHFYLWLREKNRVHLKNIVPPIKKETEKELTIELSQDLESLVKLLNVDTLPWKTWRNHENTES